MTLTIKFYAIHSKILTLIFRLCLFLEKTPAKQNEQNGQFRLKLCNIISAAGLDCTRVSSLEIVNYAACDAHIPTLCLRHAPLDFNILIFSRPAQRWLYSLRCRSTSATCEWLIKGTRKGNSRKLKNSPKKMTNGAEKAQAGGKLNIKTF